MQPMAKPGVKIYEGARQLSARTGVRIVLLIDVLLLIGGATWSVLYFVRVCDWFGALAFLTCAGSVFFALGSVGLRPRAVSWRRRLGLVMVILVLLRNGPFEDTPVVAALITLWTGVVWIALLLEGRRIAAAVVEATGEEGLGEDPSRHL